MGAPRPLLLYVDDDPDALEFLSVLLREEGFGVATSASVSEALRKVSVQAPDLLLVDYQMPAANGIELCRAMRADPATQHIPIILYTAHSPPRKSSLYNRVLSKPMGTAQLVGVIRDELKRTHAAKEKRSQG